ncbi:MAG: 50S ribosomal protein L9 [Phycisphaeraceae bacterium]|nr:50S ribosomal protein L9 [Phycisphaerales bacterium]QOJ18705.1 MAG: 50S ribosomal protein L9 [Phycisphaeraceae bacterium]
MAKKSLELLLIENVENLGIVGDVVKVRSGYARNFLLPHGLAEAPTKKRLAELQERRKRVQEELAQQRQARVALHARMAGLEVRITRSCNDQGMLYGSVSQRDISDALIEAGYDVPIRAVRLGQPIKRVGDYHVPIQFERDLRCDITLHVDPDHAIGEEREEMEFDNEGNLIRNPKPKADKGAESAEESPAADKAKPDKPAKGRSSAEPEAEAKPAKAARKKDKAAAE